MTDELVVMLDHAIRVGIPPSTMNPESILAFYGYGVLFVGTLLEGETFLLSAAVLAYLGHLEWPTAVATAFAGAYLGDQVCFHLGRAGRRLPVTLSPRWRRRPSSAHRLLDRHQIKILLGYRFLYGLRSAIPFAIGAAGFRSLQFAFLSAIGTGIWVGTTCLAGAFLTEIWR
jgi:membrane protein DedA with SNARE-associated domain